MYDFSAGDPTDKPNLYQELLHAAQALVAGERDAIANMANISALIWHFLPDLNWAGFYRLIDNELVLGPFQGKAACIHIPMGKGVCGTAAATLSTQCIADVHAFPGHIACDAASASEIVVPLLLNGRLIAVLDLDSPLPARFDAQDVKGLEQLCEAIAPALAG